MDNEEKITLNLCSCYSHLDERHVKNFEKHIAPLKTNGLIDHWYDRKILPGQEFQEQIDNNLENADVISLHISANFLNSPACMKEKDRAIKLKEQKGIVVIPIILSPCGWKDDKDISSLLSLPTDGRPITSFPTPDDAWNDVYNGLKKVIEQEIKIRHLKLTEAFSNFLQDAEMLTKAHSQKERVFLDDIFVYPELDKYDKLRAYKEKINSEELIKNIHDHPKIVIAGEDQSGKTTLCKIIFKELRKRNFLPIYVSDKDNLYRGRIENIISRSFQEQYDCSDINKIDKKKIIPIVDDFHFAKYKEKHIEHLHTYASCIIIVDDIFSLNIRDEKLISSFDYFKIREFKPSLRYELIKKWVCLTDKATLYNYKEIDKRIELIDTILGRIIGKGVMPAYPFYILSAIVTYETFNVPLNQEITSQGYCYQALIYFYLRRAGVKNDEIDIYINFLTELAFYFYKKKKNELSPSDFESFMNSYREKFTLPIKLNILLEKLNQIISVDSFNNYLFRYPYLYYFFVAKYLAEHIMQNEINDIIKNLIQNLHVDENAYITIFIAHHSKNIQILKNIEKNALNLFNKYVPATLTKDEMKFFDEQADIIIKAALPPINITPEKERTERLKIQDEMEQIKEDANQKNETNKDLLEIELRRAIKTAEVMGNIIKNRVGSLEKTELEGLFKEAMFIHLRILSFVFELIKSEKTQKGIIDLISTKLEEIIEKREGKLNRGQLEKISRAIFWNMNFFLVYGLVNKIVHSLGFDKLTEIINKVNNDINTPATFIVKHGIFMWYNKNLQIDEIAAKIKDKSFSKIAERVMDLMIINHCAMHQVSYKDRQKIESKLRIPPNKLFRGLKS